MAVDKDKEQEPETRWIDAQIRWDDVVEPPELSGVVEREKSVDNDDNVAPDIFADPHPQETFVFTEQPPPLSRTNSDNDDNTINNMIHVRLDGYKADSDAVWQSTGLTLWTAAISLSRYLLMQYESVVRPGQTILEVKCV
jgi:hypothetical protein